VPVGTGVVMVLGLLGRRIGLMLRLLMVWMGLGSGRESKGQTGDQGQPESLSGESVAPGQWEREPMAGATVSAPQSQPCGSCYQWCGP